MGRVDYAPAFRLGSCPTTHTMKIEVALVPNLVYDVEAKVCIAVDVLRATSTLVVLIERGVKEVVVCRRLAQARRLARLTHYVLCGEKDSVPPRDFDSHGVGGWATPQPEGWANQPVACPRL